MFCKVNQCAHPNFHVTREHYCRKCKGKGHGIVECGKEDKLQSLDPFIEEELPFIHHCQVPSCNRKTLHISEAHYCHTCRHLVPCIHMSFGLALTLPTPETSLFEFELEMKKESDQKESKKEKRLKCPVCRKINIIPSTQSKMYHENPATCAICQDRPVEIFLPECGHAVLCTSCAEKLSEE